MQPFGKTYLIKCETEERITNVNGLYIVNDINKLEDIYWKGVVESYGTGWTEDEKKDLVPIGSKIVMSYGKDKTSDKGGVKLIIKDDVYYIRAGKEILGVIEDE